MPETACAHPNPSPHQLGVQVEGTGEEQHSQLPVFSLQALIASVVAVGTGGKGRGTGPDFHQPRAYSLGCVSGWEALGWRDKRDRQRFLKLIQASNLLSTEAEEPYYTVEFTAAQGAE